MELSIYPKPYFYLYNYRTETDIFIAKNNYDSLLNWYKYFFHFELLASQQYDENETEKKFKNLVAINLVKYSFEFLVRIEKYLGHTGTPKYVQNSCIKLSGFGVDTTRVFLNKK